MNFIIPKTAESMKGEIFSCFNLCPCEAVGCGQSPPHGRLGTLSDGRLLFAEEYTSIPRMR